MGAKQSTNPNSRSRAFSNNEENPAVSSSNGTSVQVTAGSSGVDSTRARTRSLGNPDVNGHSNSFRIPPVVISGSAVPTPGSSNAEQGATPRMRAVNIHSTRYMQAHSLPVHLFPFNAGIKCPVCNKFIQPDEVECHLVMCLTKPRLHYNEDVLTEDKGECVICLDELTQGDTIARLPCLCIYHKTCIDQWFSKNRSCPEHPND